jgi:glycerol-3-phosphate acyltransferase PlsX
VLTAPLTIALDAMGGDHAPDVVIEGVQIAHVRLPDVRYLLFGDEARIRPLLERFPDIRSVLEVRHTDEVVKGGDKPSQVLRTGKQTSMWLAIKAVHDKEAAGVVSAGNTGALMALSKFLLRMVPGIDRPAIAGFYPTERGESVMLDLGANVVCDAENLVEFAIMGEVFARIVLGVEEPTVGLLNVGSEELKGNDAVRNAAAILKNGHLPLNFYGFVEGNDITKGTVDVVVADGFSGNIALKAAEGTANLYQRFLREAFSSSWLAQLGYLLARPALVKVKMRTDPRRYNGAMLLGLNGITVKSHGGTDAEGFANAIGVAVDLVRQNFNERIKEELLILKSSPQAANL